MKTRQKAREDVRPKSSSRTGHGTIFLTFAHELIDEYHFIEQSKSWSEAQQYCREHFTDLATIQREEDLSRVHIPAGQVAWIGLHDDPAAWFKVMTNASNSWRWSVTGATSPGGFQNWNTADPDKWSGKEACVIIADSKWIDILCPINAHCLCFKVQEGVKQFILVSNYSRTWLGCQSMCRQNYQDLAQIESAEENQAAMTASAGVAYAWIGLYRNIWLWSDLSNSSFRNWKLGSPNNMDNNEHCVLMNEDGLMEDDTCSEPQSFVCHEVKQRRSVLQTQMRIQTDLDLSDAAVSEQLLKLLQERLQEKIPGTDFKLRWSKAPEKKDSA
uniref:C-type lectin domain-containing protein n=1 Tax=Knipowitschia caucasica TaxID=637954 RepID=A0AAV2LW07_KNICA